MKIILIKVVILIGIIIGGFLLFITITDYRPDPVIDLLVHSSASEVLDEDQTFTIFTWNIGYGGLGDSEDFFLDGGKKGKPDSKEVVLKYMDGILESLENMKSDFAMIQEIDIDSSRTYHINELDLIKDKYKDYEYSFAKNFDVKFVPLPWPPMGEVEAGMATFSKYKITDSKRYKFEGNYKWPKSTIMLDRCFITTRIELPDREGDILLINAHFSAYDDGSLKEGQLNTIKNYILTAYENGDYVILGGDWNQTFEVIDISGFPLFMNGEYFNPSIIPENWLEEGWKFAVNNNAPTYRLLNAPYEEGVSQTGVIDGFLISPNVEVKEVKVVDLGFENSDHNPVIMEFELK